MRWRMERRLGDDRLVQMRRGGRFPSAVLVVVVLSDQDYGAGDHPPHHVLAIGGEDRKGGQRRQVMPMVAFDLGEAGGVLTERSRLVTIGLYASCST